MIVQHANHNNRLDPLTWGCTLDAYNKDGFDPFEIRKNSFKFQWKTRKKNLVVGVITSVLIAAQGSNSADAAAYSIDHLKLYAHSRILDYQEFICFEKIITRESRWSYTARNGSHYGLGQMRSTYYRDLDPFRQLDASIRYVTKRYQTPCNALAFHNVKGYY